VSLLKSNCTKGFTTQCFSLSILHFYWFGTTQDTIQIGNHKGITNRALPQYKVLFPIKFLNPKNKCYNKVCHVLIQVRTAPNNRTTQPELWYHLLCKIEICTNRFSGYNTGTIGTSCQKQSQITTNSQEPAQQGKPKNRNKTDQTCNQPTTIE
jgi:hypothetical protein